jgi:hypothetical protein
MPTIRESIARQEAEGETDTDKIIRTAAEESGSKLESAVRIFQKVHRTSSPKAISAPVASGSLRTVSLKDLVDKERLDTGAILQKALNNLKPGECVYDDVFPRDLGICLDTWRRDVRNREEFLCYQVQLPNKKRVWSNRETREMLLSLDGVREVIS